MPRGIGSYKKLGDEKIKNHSILSTNLHGGNRLEVLLQIIQKMECLM